jgi:hypothetical protein
MTSCEIGVLQNNPLADLIDKEEWSSLGADVKGDAYEGLLQKNAEDVKGGAGQYFTPRPLIQAIVDVMQPKPGSAPNQGFVICDPACGTGGFLLASHEFIRRQKLDKSQLQSAQVGTSICGTAMDRLFALVWTNDDSRISRSTPAAFMCISIIMQQPFPLQCYYLIRVEAHRT